MMTNEIKESYFRPHGIRAFVYTSTLDTHVVAFTDIVSDSSKMRRVISFILIWNFRFGNILMISN